MPSFDAWETAMGMGGYRGSPAEADDRTQDIKVGGKCAWKAEGFPIADIVGFRQDDAGDPQFELQFVGEFADHKNVWADRNELIALPYRDGHLAKS